jgi:hypothetical protein
MEDANKPCVPIRLVFQLERDEDPAVYDELMRFKQGVKRVNRLRMLVHDGLLAQRTWLRVEPLVDGLPTGRSAAAHRATNDVFGPGLD